MRSLPRRVFDEIAAEASYRYRRIARPRTISQRGVRLPIDHASYSEPVLEMLNRGWYEGTEAEILIKVLRPDDVVLELGTGIGFSGERVVRLLDDLACARGALRTGGTELGERRLNDWL